MTMSHKEAQVIQYLPVQRISFIISEGYGWSPCYRWEGSQKKMRALNRKIEIV